MKNTLNTLLSAPTILGNFCRNCLRDTPGALKLQIVVMLSLLVIGFAALSNAGCSTTAAGLSKEQKLYQTGTNVVATIDKIATALPPPANSILELGTALAAAGLGAWNVWQHKAIAGLKNGQGLSIAAQASSTAFAAGHAAGLKAATQALPAPGSAQPTPAPAPTAA